MVVNFICGIHIGVDQIWGSSLGPFLLPRPGFIKVNAMSVHFYAKSLEDCSWIWFSNTALHLFAWEKLQCTLSACRDRLTFNIFVNFKNINFSESFKYPLINWRSVNVCIPLAINRCTSVPVSKTGKEPVWGSLSHQKSLVANQYLIKIRQFPADAWLLNSIYTVAP